MGLLGSVITSLIVVFFIAGFYANVLLRRRWLSLSEELAAFCSGEINEFRSDMLTWVTEEYKESLNSGAEAVNTGGIIDMAIQAYQRLCILGESYLKKVNGLLITTGLFGTFLGLTTAVGTIGGMMAETGAETLVAQSGVTTFKMLVSSFQGMSVAFITSLFGTGFSILLSVITTLIGSGDARELFITQLEEYLDVKVQSETAEAKKEQILDHKEDIHILSDTLMESLTIFNQTVCSYTEELRSLKGFNQELGNLLEKAGMSAALLCQSFDKSSEAFCQSGAAISDYAADLKSLVKEINYQNGRLENTYGVFAELSRKIEEATEDRSIFLKVLTEIPDRLLNYTEAAVAGTERGR